MPSLNSLHIKKNMARLEEQPLPASEGGVFEASPDDVHHTPSGGRHNT